MTTTVDQLARDIVGSIPTNAGTPLIVRWIDNRYQELVSRVRFRHLRQIGELSLPALVTAGTITATRGSTTITPDATAQAAWVTSPGVASHNDWYFRASSVWYRISSVDALAATITLDSAFAEDNIVAGSYTIAKRYHSLNSTARWLGTFLFPRLRYQLDQLALDELNILEPSRILTGIYPKYITQIGVDSSGYNSVEIYPPPENTELIQYIYWSLPTSLSFGSNIPQVIDSYVLKEGVMIDIWRFEKKVALDKGNVEQAAVCANEEAKQRTIWETKIKDAIRTSRGADDIAFLLQMFRGSRSRTTDQRTARDYIMDNWRR